MLTAEMTPLWRDTRFLRFWAAETFSQLGSQISALALPLVAVLTLRASPLEVAALTAVEYAPFVLFALPVGVWVDRLPRQAILVIADVGRAAALAMIPLIFATGPLTMWHLYVAGFVVGALTVWFDTAYLAFVPELVDRSRLVDANSKLELSRSASALAGPSLAGWLIALLGAITAILVDAASFIVSAILLLSIEKFSLSRAWLRETFSGFSLRGTRQDIALGVRFVIAHSYLRAILITTAAINFFAWGLTAVLILYAVRELGMTAFSVGVMFSIGNAGFVIGAVAAPRVTARAGVGASLVIGLMLMTTSMLLVPLAPREHALIFLATYSAVSGIGLVLFNVNQLSLRQALTPDRMQGRMNSTMRFVNSGAIPIGAISGGAIAEWATLRTTAAVAALGMVITLLWLLISSLPGLRDLSDVADPEATADDARGSAGVAGIESARRVGDGDGSGV